MKKPIYYIYENTELGWKNEPSNQIRYFVDTENSYNRTRGQRNYVPYNEYIKDPNARARVSIWKGFLRKVSEEEIILDKLTR